MKGLSFEVESPYFSCFRTPTSTSLLLTFSVPPFTTVRGLIANCMGLPRFPEYSEQLVLQQKMKIGIQTINLNDVIRDKSVELCKLLKLVSREKWEDAPRPKPWTFPSSPIFKEFLVNPRYKIFIVADEKTISDVYSGVMDPKRPLYLGQSDDMVDIYNIQVTDFLEAKSSEIWSLVEGVHENCEVVKLPYTFSEDGKSLNKMTLSIPLKYPQKLKNEVACYKVNDEFVTAY